MVGFGILLWVHLCRSGGMLLIFVVLDPLPVVIVNFHHHPFETFKGQQVLMGEA